MKKVVLVLDGIVSQKFLNTILEKYFSNNLYIVIVRDEGMIPNKIPSAFSFYSFDPTSKYRIESVIENLNDISDIFILLPNVEEKIAVFNLFKELCKESRIITFEEGLSEYKNANKHERHLYIDAEQIIASQFTSRLPNVPVIPNGFGLGQGEIMEVNVPFGSAYAYRHIGSIQQSKYKIVGLYRNNNFHLATFSLVIQPQDVLLLAGDPKTLNTAYKQIKASLGQFPSPFGRDIYLYVDMKKQTPKEAIYNVKEAIFAHSQIKSTKLFIIIFNPRDFKTIDSIKELCKNDSSINLAFEYREDDFLKRLAIDSEKKIGLIIVGSELFKTRKVRRALFNTNSPVLKTANRSLKEVKTCFISLNEEMSHSDNISPILFDIAIQTNTQICVYDFEPDGAHQNETIKDYETLGRSLDKKIQVIKTQIKNPIFYLNELEEAVLHYIPFREEIIKANITSIFTLNTEEVFSLNNKHPQLLIPSAKH